MNQTGHTRRWIAHLDADAFFAAVEQAADRRLRGRPVAVGGQRRGVIASASYEARRYGIRPAMPIWKARQLCPNLIILPPDYDKYELFSRWMFSYVYDFTPYVEIRSIDRGYFDLSGIKRPPEEVLKILKIVIAERLKITVSEGLSSSKLVSELGVKLKKPNALEIIPPGKEREFLAPLPIRLLPGVGKELALRLETVGLCQIGQLAQVPIEQLTLLVGKAAFWLHEWALGNDPRPVVPVDLTRQSLSYQHTFLEDQTDPTIVAAVLKQIADVLCAKLRQNKQAARTITVRVRYSDMEQDQISETLSEPVDDEAELYGRLEWILMRVWRRRVALRMVGLRLSSLWNHAPSGWLELDEEARRKEARRRLAAKVDELRARFGYKVIRRGHDLLLEKYQPRSCLPHLQESCAYQKDGKEPAINILVKEERIVPVPLLTRSYYSFFQSTLSPSRIVEMAERNGLEWVCLCDCGNLHGAPEFFAALKQRRLEGVLGVEVTTLWGELLLFVETREGYAQLCRLLSSQHQVTSTHDTIRSGEIAIDPAEIAQTSGLIAVGRDPRWANLLKGRFYLGVRDLHEVELYRWKYPTIPQVPWLEVQIADPTEELVLRVLQSIQTLTLLDQPHPKKALSFPGAISKIKEVGWIKSAARLLDGLEEIRRRCQDFVFPFGPPQFPPFRAPDDSSSFEFLRKLAFDGMRRRYPVDQWPEVGKKLEEELSIIREVGYEDYFLLVWEMLRMCEERGIQWLTRGSAADSLICYCLGISNVCPIRFKLYFKRFLNRDRMAFQKLPDIDIDFPYDRRDEVVEWLLLRYGPEHAAAVGGFSTFRARSAFAEVAKVLGVPEQEVRRFTKLFPWSFGDQHEGEEEEGDDVRLIEAIRTVPECRDLPLEEEPWKKALELAARIEGFPRYRKMHPCGIVISRDPLYSLCPTFVSTKGWPTTHFDMDGVEAVGLVKLDILGQAGLAVIRDTLQVLAETGVRYSWSCGQVEKETRYADVHCNHTDIERLPEPVAGESFADPCVWQLIQRGEAVGVHHIESPAMISLAKMLKVQDIKTLIGMVSVIRPGAANEQKKREFVRRYLGLSPIEYAHPLLEEILNDTFGLVVYEEHVMQICEHFAGMSIGEADCLRRALVKEDWGKVAELKRLFYERAFHLGRTQEEIDRVWSELEKFHGYAFCKAHSTAYAIEAYQAAWLKARHPAEFLACVLTHGRGFYRPIVYVLECWRLGIPLLPPSINEPSLRFRVINWNAPRLVECGKWRAPFLAQKAIRLPLTCVRNLSESTFKRILEERRRGRFSSIEDFCVRVRPEIEEIDQLVRAGAFDEIDPCRERVMWQVYSLRRRYAQAIPSQLTLIEPSEKKDPWGAEFQADKMRYIQWELEAIGYPVSGHPLELYPRVRWETYCPSGQLRKYIGQEVVVCGLVVVDRLHHQRDGKLMKFLTLADWWGFIELECHAQEYQRYGAEIAKNAVLEATVRVERGIGSFDYQLHVVRLAAPRQK